MKKLIRSTILLFIFLASTNTIYSQQDTIAESTLDFWNIVYDYDTGNLNSGGMSKKPSEDEAYALAKKYYDAVSNDPVGFNKYLENQYNHWIDSVKKGYPVQLKKPGVLLAKIKEIIADKYGKHFVQIISVPCFLKVKILKDTVSQYVDSNYPKDRNLQANLTCLVEEVLKGDKYFKTGQQINVSFMLSWLAFDMKNRVAPTGDQHFTTGKSYLIPIRFWDSSDSSQLVVYCFNDAYFPIYPVENEIISVPDNYYDAGEISDWKTFKSTFTQKYILKLA